MKKSGYVIKSLANASGVFIYVLSVSWLLFNANGLFGEKTGPLVPLFLLLLLIVSATVTGLLVLWKPISLYLGGFKKEAVVLLFATLSWLIVFLIAVVAVMIMR